MVDVTLYRDDGFGPSEWPVVGVTKIPFVLKEHTVILVDDVLYTGRTVRAAIDAILDYGRPRAVRPQEVRAQRNTVAMGNMKTLGRNMKRNRAIGTAAPTSRAAMCGSTPSRTISL